MMKYIMNRGFLFCALLGLAVVSCSKRGEEKPVVSDPNEIVIKASRMAVSVESDVSSRVAVPNEFGVGSSIGLYTCTSEEPTVMLQSNCGYDFATPNWRPKSAADRLLYHPENKPIYIYGYHPYGGPSTVASGQEVVYTMPLDQTTLENVQAADLMWVAAKDGYQRSSQAISLPFAHKLCKLIYRVMVTDSKPTAESAPQVVLSSIRFSSSDWPMTTTLDMVTGQAVASASDGQTHDIIWKPEGGMTLTVGAEPVVVTEMILIPHNALNGTTAIYFSINNGGMTFRAPIERYEGAEKPEPPSKGLRFAENDQLQVLVSMDVSTQVIKIEASILGWDDGSNVDLGGDRE